MPLDAQKAIEQAEIAITLGDFSRARLLLKGLLSQQPDNVSAWILLSEVVEKPDQKLDCLQRAQKLDPDNPVVQEKLNALQPPEPQTHVTATPAPPPSFQADSLPPAPLTTPETLQKPPLAEIQADIWKKKKKTSPMTIVAIVLAGVCFCALAPVVLLMATGTWSSLTSSLGISSGGKAEVSEEAVRRAVVLNVNASNREDLAGYMATIHPRSPSYDYTEEMLQKINLEYDLAYTMEVIDVLSVSDNEAEVAFTLKTVKVNGPAFRDNRISGVMFLRPDDGVWKIYSQRIDSTDYLDD